jgi:hypothetical protein
LSVLFAVLLLVGSAAAQERASRAAIDRYRWQVFNNENSDLPADWVSAVAVGVDGAIWIGTSDGLARLADGQWQLFTPTNSALPAEYISALAVGPDGAVWVGTNSGLGALGWRPVAGVHRIQQRPPGGLGVGAGGGAGWYGLDQLKWRPW